MSFTIPLAALTLMMWIIWSDSIRPRRPSPVLAWLRVVLFLAASTILLANLFRTRGLPTGVIALTIVAALIGLAGAVYFFRRARG